MRWYRRQANQAGDTLIEVVIALAILAATLTSAYDIANISYSVAIQAREHTQAAYLAQGQAEKLIYYRDSLITADPSSTNKLFTPTTFGMCNGGSCHFDIGSIAPTAGSFSPPLQYGVNGTQYTVSIGPYQGGATFYNAAGNEGTFSINVQWESALSTQSGSGFTNANTTNLNVVLADKRGIVPRDCSVVGNIQVKPGNKPC